MQDSEEAPKSFKIKQKEMEHHHCYGGAFVFGQPLLLQLLQHWLICWQI
jgi:hypothetical protein